VRVLNANWQDETTFPAEKADVLLGSDLVYDSSILAILVPAVDKMMTQGEVFHQCNRLL
jgi:predicted nicotinamide N-methyase